MDKISLNVKYIWEVIKQKFSSSRFLTFIILQLFVLQILLSPIKNFSKDVNYTVSPWSLPFLFSNVYFYIFFMFIIIYYFSNVPFMQYSEMYQIIRTGRRKWTLGKIINIVFSSFVIIFLEFILSLIPFIGRLHFENDWGKILYTLSLSDAGMKYNIRVNYNIINFYTPLKAMGLLILIGGLIICFVGLLMFALSIFASRLIAIFVASAFTILPIINLNVISYCKWLIFLSPISWFDLCNISTQSGYNLPTFFYVISILTSAIIILSILIMWKINTINFQWNMED